MARLPAAAGAGGAGRLFNAAIAAAVSIPSAGVAAAVLRSVRPAWMKMCGACRATTSPGSALTAVNSTGSAISENDRAGMMRGYYKSI